MFDRSEGIGLVLVGAGLLALFHGCWLWWPITVDDTYITFRYSQNLVEGLGPVWNPGERVEGYTHPSWMLLLAAVMALGLPPLATAKLLGTASSVALVALLWASLRRAGIPGAGAGLASLLLGSSYVLQIWSVAGLETNLYALLFFAGLLRLAGPATPRGALAASAWLAAAALTRPEGLAYWALGALRMTLPPGERLRRAAFYALPGLVLLGHLAWRLSYYGVPFPNTYYVKTGGVELWLQGLRGLGGFLSDPAHALWLLAGLAGVVVADRVPERRRGAAIMAGASLLHLLYVASVGDDGLHVHRFYVPVLAPLAWLVGLAFGGGRAVAGLAAAAVLLSSAVSFRELRFVLAPAFVPISTLYEEGNVKLGRWLAENRDPDTWVALAAAGATPYYSRLPTIDMYGLNDAHIARQPFPEIERGRLMKFDNEYVLSRRPDLIVINRGYFRADHPLAKQAPQPAEVLVDAPMDADLFRRIRRDGSYRLAPVRFDDGSVFWVFERDGSGATRSKSSSG